MTDPGITRITQDIDRAFCAGVGAALPRSVIECDSDMIAPPPDQPTLANGMKIIERQLKIWRKYVEAIQHNPGTDIGDVSYLATKYTRLSAEKQQRGS
jgi:hypothetical protein